MSKKFDDQKPAREPMAIFVPDEELSQDALLYLYHLERSEEFFQAKVRLRDKLRRGLIPGIPPKPHQVIDELKNVLTSQQLELLRWLADRDGMSASLADIARYRQELPGEIGPDEEATERKFCGRLRKQLERMSSCVQIDILRGQKVVRLLIRPASNPI
jgi:hypothetical protein